MEPICCGCSIEDCLMDAGCSKDLVDAFEKCGSQGDTAG